MTSIEELQTLIPELNDSTTHVFSYFIQPLFDRTGLVNFTHKYEIFIGSEESSKILSTDEIAVFCGKRNKPKYVRLFKLGFNKKPYGKIWTIDTDFSNEISKNVGDNQLCSMLFVFETDSIEDFEKIKNFIA